MSEDALPPLETLKFAQELLDVGRSFAAHEVFEALWKASPAQERALWQGLAQLCVGLTHGARGNSVGATRLVERGAARLLEYTNTDSPAYGLNLSLLIERARRQVADPSMVEQVLHFQLFENEGLL